MENKKEWTKQIIEPIVKEAGYSSCDYENKNDREVIELKDEIGRVLLTVNVSMDSKLAMVYDVMKNIY